MKRSHSEIKDDVTISLKYPRLRKWTRELAFQSGEIACTDDRKYQIRCLAGIKQASTGKLYYVFNISLQNLCVLLSRFSHVRLFATPWTVAHQVALSTGYSRQEYWSGLPCLLPGDLPNPGIKPTSLCLLLWQIGSLPLAPPGKLSNPQIKKVTLSVASCWKYLWTLLTFQGKLHLFICRVARVPDCICRKTGFP